MPRENKSKLRYIIYARKSRTDERQERSVPDQIKKCLTFVKDNKLNLVKDPNKVPDFVIDGVVQEEGSARMPHNRPFFRMILDELNSPNPRFDGIIAWHPNRLARNPLEAGEIVQLIDDDKIKDLQFCTYIFHNDASGKEHLMMEFARAKGYSDHLSVDVTRGLELAFEKGGAVYGKAKPGYIIKKGLKESHGRFEAHPINFALLRKAYEMRAEGKPFATISKEIEPQYEGGFSKSTVERVLKDSFYYGLWVINKVAGGTQDVDLRTIGGYNFEAVVNEDEWFNVQRVNEREGMGQNVIPRSKKPLAGLVKCSACGKPRYPSASTSGSASREWRGKKVLAYACQTKGCEEKGSTNAERVVFPAIGKILKDGLNFTEKQHKIYLYTLIHDLKEQSETYEKRKKHYENLAKSTRKELQEAALSLGGLSRATGEEEKYAYEETKKKMAELKEEADNYDKLVSELNNKDLQTYEHFEDFLELTRNAHKYWALADWEKKYELADILISNLTCSKKKIAEIKLKEPFAAWQKGLSSETVLNGRGDWT